MPIEQLFLILVPILFSVIHFTEFSSYLVRIAGLRVDAKMTGYAIQQIAFVMTRFFFVAMMPMIGFIVDKRVESNEYLLMIHAALAGATLLYIFVLFNLGEITNRFIGVVRKYARGSGILASIFEIKRQPESIESGENKWNGFVAYLMKSPRERKTAFLSALVFSCYAIAVFLSFFVALQFFEYRSSIGQMSGLINGIATIILSLFIEPNLSRSVDAKAENADFMVYSILLGRLIGVGIVAQLVVASMWIFI